MFNEKDLIKQLNNLSSQIQPDKVWKAKTREILLSQIGSQYRQKTGGFFGIDLNHFVNLVIPYNFIIRGAVFVVLLVSVVFGGSITAVKASLSAVPGQTLYALKLAVEIFEKDVLTEINPFDRQVDRELKRAELEIKFAGRRVEEVKQIIETETDLTVKASKVKAPLVKYSASIKSVQATVDQINKSGETMQAVKLAAVASEVATGYKGELENTQKDLNDNSTQNSVSDAIEKSEEVNSDAVNLIIEKHESGEAKVFTDDELKNKVEESIKSKNDELGKVILSLETKLIEKKDDQTIDKNLAEKLKKESEALLLEAKNLLAGGDLSGAMGKVKEVSEKIKLATAILDPVESDNGVEAQSNDVNMNSSLTPESTNSNINSQI